MTRTPLEFLPLTSIAIVGAGQIGRPLAARLASLGHRTTLISRRVPAAIPDGVDHRACDASDAAALATILRESEATAVILAANPETYSADVWRARLFPLQRGVVAACRATERRLVVLECLYMHGPTERMSPTSPLDATTRKGRIRIELTEELAEAARTGLDVVRYRAPDFYGRGLTSAVVGEDAIARVSRGSVAVALGNPEIEHAFAHRDDVVDGLARLALEPGAFEGEVFVAPSVHTSQRALLDAYARQARGPGARARLFAIPTMLLTVLGWFAGFAREFLEMSYLWTAPYRVDDGAFRARFGIAARSIDEAVRIA